MSIEERGCAMPCGTWVVQGMVTVNGRGGEADVAGLRLVGGKAEWKGATHTGAGCSGAKRGPS